MFACLFRIWFLFGIWDLLVFVVVVCFVLLLFGVWGFFVCLVFFLGGEGWGGVGDESNGAFSFCFIVLQSAWVWQYSTDPPSVWLDYDGPPSDIQLERSTEKDCNREQTSSLRRTLQIQDSGRVYRCASRWNGSVYRDYAATFPVGTVTLSGKWGLVPGSSYSVSTVVQGVDTSLQASGQVCGGLFH